LYIFCVIILWYDVIIFHGQQMLLFLCYHFPLYIFCVIIYVIIWRYQLLLSFPPFFIFPENVTHSFCCQFSWKYANYLKLFQENLILRILASTLRVIFAAYFPSTTYIMLICSQFPLGTPKVRLPSIVEGCQFWLLLMVVVGWRTMGRRWLAYDGSSLVGVRWVVVG
jgi:hypothetical protein